MRKKIFIRVVIGVLVVVIIMAGLIFYIFNSMTPLETGRIGPNLDAAKTGIVNFFIYHAGDTLVCFDAGLDTAQSRKALSDLRISPEKVAYVFLTHSDGDHVNGLPLFSNAKVFLPFLEEQMINGTTQRMFFFRKRNNSLPVKNYTLIKDPEIVKIGSTRIKAINTPGHTPGSTSYLINDSILVVGDIANIKEGQLTVPLQPFNNDTELAKKSLEHLEKSYPKVLMVLTAHDGFARSTKNYKSR